MAARRSKASVNDVYCRPASQCCCGCSLEFGCKAILAFQLLRNLLVIFMAVTTMVFHSARFEFAGGSTTQIITAGLALAGVPVIAAAAWGIMAKAESPIRLYVYYMFFVMGVDIFFVLKDMVISGPCTSMPGLHEQSGAAFACGMARIFNSVTIFFIMGVEMYFIFVVASYAEELQLRGGTDLSDLAYYNDPKQRIHDSISAGGYYDAMQEYGSLETREQVLGGSTAIFGQHHELRYPPPGGH